LPLGAELEGQLTTTAPQRCVTPRLNGAAISRVGLAQADVARPGGGDGPRKHQPLQWNMGNVHRYTLRCDRPYSVIHQWR
jgi:hypothetical protein